MHTASDVCEMAGSSTGSRQPQGLEGPSKNNNKTLSNSIPNVVILLVVLGAGAFLGWLTPNTKLSGWWATAQSATGWSYTLAW